MPYRGVDKVRRNLAEVFKEISGPKAKATVAEVLNIGGAYAALMTPVDTSNLINSRIHSIEQTPEGIRGRVFFTADYAAAVHGMSGKLKGQPREDFGAGFGGGTGVGNYWDPDAEPEFLTKGFEQHLPELRAAIKRGMQL